jgi:hypothetical protein
MSSQIADVAPTREQERAIQMYCRQQMRLARLTDSDGAVITRKRKERSETCKNLRALIEMHNDYPVANIDSEKRCYTFVPEGTAEKVFVRLAKTSSQRAMTPVAVKSAVAQITGDEIVERTIKVIAKKQKKSNLGDVEIPMAEAVAQTLVSLVRDATRSVLLNPEVTTSKPRGWSKNTDPPMLPAGWVEPVKKMCALRDEISDLDPSYKRRRKELIDETAKYSEPVQEFFQRLPEQSRMQAVLLKPVDPASAVQTAPTAALPQPDATASTTTTTDQIPVPTATAAPTATATTTTTTTPTGSVTSEASAKIAHTSAAIMQGEQLQYLSMTTKKTSVPKLTVSKALPVIQGAVKKVFSDTVMFSRDAFEAWRSSGADKVEALERLVQEAIERHRMEQLSSAAAEPKHSLKLSTTVKPQARDYRPGDDDDDDSNDDDGDDDGDGDDE